MTHLLEAATDTLKIMPLLLAVLVTIEVFEHSLGHRLQRGLSAKSWLGPALGAIIGSLPQCGGSVLASEFYAARAISLGTLSAVYLATSDEALPILAANPGEAHWLWPVLGAKVAIGLVAGYAIDLVARVRGLRLHVPQPVDAHASAADGHHAADGSHAGVCLEPSLSIPRLLAHATQRGLRVGLLIMATTALLGWATDTLVGTGLITSLMSAPRTQVLAAAALGLIPSCATSVALTSLFVSGALGYPALIAGLCANAGTGLVVLLHESGWRTMLRVTLLQLGLSICAGLALSAVV